MPKDLIDEILESPPCKNNLMLKELIGKGLPREELLTALFDQSGMEKIKAEVYYLHYTQTREKFDDALRNIGALQTNHCMDWLSGHDWPSQLRAMKKRIEEKRDELYPSKLLPKGLTWKAMVGRKVVYLFNIIKPVVKSINKEAGHKHYSNVDIYKLIACLWAYTYGQFEGRFTHKQINKLHENNKSKIPLK